MHNHNFMDVGSNISICKDFNQEKVGNKSGENLGENE